MQDVLEKFAVKLARMGMADAGAPVLAGVDEETVWNRTGPEADYAREVWRELGSGPAALVYSQPASPYLEMFESLAKTYPDFVRPEDNESRTFLRGIAVTRETAPAAVAGVLRRAGNAWVVGRGLFTIGPYTPEQAYVVYSSACFAAFVKFCGDRLDEAADGRLKRAEKKILQQALAADLPPAVAGGGALVGPFTESGPAQAAVAEAGRLVVEWGLVDSYFGNVSYRLGETLYISQTGAPLDELPGQIDPVALDGSSCAGLTASSELAAHRAAVLDTGARAILHSHPRFTVVLSLRCERTDCPQRGACHVACPERPLVCGVPVVPGETGNGPTGLCRTVPPALAENGRGAIVRGHGIFCLGQEDFRQPLQEMLTVEHGARAEYARQAGI